jgi:hypothetical protein
MITDKDCLDKWGEPKNDAKWQSKIMTLWYADTTLVNNELLEYRESTLPSKIFMNKLLVDPFTKVIKQLIKEDLLGLIKTWDGCFFIRKMKVIKNGKITFSNRYSLHSWGVALDIDASWNQLGNCKPKLDRRIVKVFQDNGFDWGGDFKSCDGMHFQLKEI